MRLGLQISEFWQLTFAEYWPLYNNVMGKTEKPMTEADVKALNEKWANGDFRRVSDKSGSGDKRA